jgi:hypothetical protein
MADSNVTCHDILAANYTVTGIRQGGGVDHPVVITGTYSKPSQAMLYRGPLYPTDGSGYFYPIPRFNGQDASSSVFYGPNTPLFDPGIGVGNVRAVGSYKIEGSPLDHGMMYEGGFDGTGRWTTIDVPDQVAGGAVANTLAHSTMGDLVVGNYDLAGKPGSGNGFVYNVRTRTFTPLRIGDLATAYGVWQNGDSSSSSYTIAGGYKSGNGINVGFLLDYDARGGVFGGPADFNFDNQPGIVTHFEGITGVPGGYTLAAMYKLPGQKELAVAFAAVVRRSDGTFGVPTWVQIPSLVSQGLFIGNSILGNNLIGVYQPASGGLQSYLATVASADVQTLRRVMQG